MTGKNPFLLIARIGVKENMIEEYLAIAEEVDNAVQESEPGMLFHNFDKDPDNNMPQNSIVVEDPSIFNPSNEEETYRIFKIGEGLVPKAKITKQI